MSSVHDPVPSVSANPTPEQAEQQATAPAAEQDAPAPAVQESADNAAEQAAQREQEAREQADATRQAAVREYRKGERAYAAGLFESGRLCGVYIGQRLALGDKREVAVKALEGDLSRYSSTEVDVNRLTRTAHAYRLLALETGLTDKPAKNKPAPAESVPYGVYRDAWARLVERVASGREESYVLLPGLEKACRSMFRRAVRDELSPKAAGELVGKLVRAHAARLTRAEKARLAQADVKAAAEKAAAEKATADLRAAQQAAEKAAQEAKANQDEGTTEALKQAQAELEARQRAVVEQQARAEQAERERQRAEKAAKEQAERDRKAAEKAARKTEQAQKPATVAPPQQPPATDEGKNPTDQRGRVEGNLLKSAAEATPANLAESLAEQTQASSDPHDTYERYLRLIASASWADAAMKRSAKAALIRLHGTDAPSPVEVANRLPLPASAPAAELNGQPATAGAA